MRMSKEGYKMAICKSCVMGHMEKCPDENIIEWREEYGGQAPVDCMKCQNFEKVEPIKNTLVILHYEDGIKEFMQTNADEKVLDGIEHYYDDSCPFIDWLYNVLIDGDYIVIPECDFQEWEKNTKNYKLVKNIVMY